MNNINYRECFSEKFPLLPATYRHNWITHLESLIEKPVAVEKKEGEKITQSDESKPIAESVDTFSEDEEKQPEVAIKKPKIEEVKDAVEPKIVKGKNFNRECKAKQLKEKLQDTDYKFPDNIDNLLAAAVGTAKKTLSNEDEFYQKIVSNNLISLVRNSNKFKTYILPGFYRI